MKGEQGKHFGWSKIKREILLVIIERECKGEENTRGKLKDIFSAADRKERVSTKDIDYHLNGTDDKPGLIRKGIVLEERGTLRLNLTNVRHLIDIMGYLLKNERIRRAMDIEFSTCYLDDHGDRLALLHAVSDKERTSLRYYDDWISCYYPDTEKIEPNGFVKVALKRSQEWRGALTDEDRIRYIVAYYSLVMHHPKKDEDVSLYRIGSLMENALGFRNLDKIREMADGATKEEITQVWKRVLMLSEGKTDYRTFPGFQVQDIGLPVIYPIVARALYGDLDRLSFEEHIYSQLTTGTAAYSYAREIIKILMGESYISLKELDRLGEILKAFNESQKGMQVRQIFKNTEKKLKKLHYL